VNTLCLCGKKNKYFMKQILITPILLITIITLIACQPGKDIRYESLEDAQSLIDAEKKASDLSEKEGFTKAMLASADDQSVENGVVETTTAT